MGLGTLSERSRMPIGKSERVSSSYIATITLKIFLSKVEILENVRN